MDGCVHLRSPTSSTVCTVKVMYPFSTINTCHVGHIQQPTNLHGLFEQNDSPGMRCVAGFIFEARHAACLGPLGGLVHKPRNAPDRRDLSNTSAMASSGVADRPAPVQKTSCLFTIRQKQVQTWFLADSKLFFNVWSKASFNCGMCGRRPSETSHVPMNTLAHPRPYTLHPNLGSCRTLNSASLVNTGRQRRPRNLVCSYLLFP